MSYSPNEIADEAIYNEIDVLPFETKIKACLSLELVTDDENEEGFRSWKEKKDYDKELTEKLYDFGLTAEKIEQL